MSVFQFALVACVYLGLQAFAVFYLVGVWRQMAMASAIAVAFLVILAVTLGVLGVEGAEIGTFMALPLAISFLLIVLAVHATVGLFNSSDQRGNTSANASVPASHTVKGTGRTASAITRTVSQTL